MTLPGAPSGQKTTEPLFVARQPVFDRNMNVWAYSLMFYESAAQRKTGGGDADQAALRLMIDGVNVVTPSIDPQRKIIVPVSRSLLMREFAVALPAGRCVIELVGAIDPHPDVLKACRKLKQSGYPLLFGEYVRHPACQPLLQLADIIKFDLPKAGGQLPAPIPGFGGFRMAAKVEDRQVFDYVWKLGPSHYNLFQGTFFSKPEIISGRRTSASQVSKMRLIAELSKPDFSPGQLAKILQTDASLSLKLFNHVNSAVHGLRNKVNSVQHAITVLGEVQARKWLRVVLLTDLAANVSTDEVLFLSAQRGRFLELLSSTVTSSPMPPDSMFLLGLFSLLESLTGMPLQELMRNLPFDDKMKTMLCDTRNPWLMILSAQERGQWNEVELLLAHLGLDGRKTAYFYSQAMEWAWDVLKVKSTT